MTAILFQPSSWQTLSASNFTPLVSLSFKLDLLLAGVQPLFFYGHQIVSLSLLAVALYLLLRRWSEIAAIIAALTLIVLPVSALAARALMVRHYVEGGLLALLAAALWAGSGVKGRTSWLRLAGTSVLYLAAMSAKEIYAPLPLLLIAIALIDRWNVRVLAMRLIPISMTAGLYLVWRWWMLGSLGGYGSGPETASLLALPGKIMTAVIGVDAAAPALLILTACLTAQLMMVRRRGRAVAVLALLLLAILLPVLAVAAQFDWRYAFSAGLGLSALSGFLLSGLLLRYRLAGVLIIVTVLSALLWRGNVATTRTSAREAQMVAEGRYLWTSRPGSRLLLGWSPGWYLAGIAELRLLQSGVSAPAFRLSEAALLIEGIDPASVNTSKSGQSLISPLDLASQLALHERAALEVESAPLSIEFAKAGNRVSWRFGPPCDCRFIFLAVPGYDDFEVPPAGTRIVPAAQRREQFRVMKAESSGAWTVSPALWLPLDQGVTRWKRD